MPEEEAVRNLREYLRIPSVHPDVDYDGCVEFLKRQAKSLNLPVKVIYPTPRKPVVIISLEGSQTQLPSILLNSHMDVVPVFREKWTHDPFGAEKDSEGNIYGRGAQDMKSVGIQYLEAVRRLRRQGQTFRRTVHLTFVPEEEVGGEEGMGKFVRMEEFKALNVGCSMDEGMPSTDDSFLLFYGERSIWQVHIHCEGSPGHGSLLLADTAGEKIRKVIDAFMDLRDKERAKLANNPELTLGDVTTINLTILKGGVQNNVIPPELVAGFDCRLSSDVDFVKFENWINEVCKSAGDGVYPEFQQKQDAKAVTRLDSSNSYWTVLEHTAHQMGVKLRKAIFPAGTDSRFLREIGIPAFGLSWIDKTPVLLHDHDEYINEKTFLKGIDFYAAIIPALANS